MIKNTPFGILLALVLAVQAPGAFAQQLDSTMLHIGSSQQFFFDNLLIESAQNVTRHVDHPKRQLPGPVIRRDQPWEHVTYFTVSSWNVAWDPMDQWFKCWYEDWKFLTRPVGKEKMHTPLTGQRGSRYLFARSCDGVNWEKPPLGLVREDGRDTNIVLGDQEFGTVHSGYVFLDPAPKRRDERYKIFYNRIRSDFNRYEIASSEDGVHWKAWEEHPSVGLLGPRLGDVLTISVDRYSGIYRLNSRHPLMSKVAGWEADPFLPYYPANPSEPGSSFMRPVYPGDFSRENRRRVFRAESADFIHWTGMRPLFVPDAQWDNIDEAFYGMTQIPLGDNWVGFLHVLKMTDNTMHVELVYSRDGEHFQRVQPGRAWLAGTGRAGDWDRHMVNVYGAPVSRGDELYIFYGGSSNHHDWWIEGAREGLDVPEARDLGLVNYALGLIRIKTDRFVSMRALPVREGILVTRPLADASGQLLVNAACRDGGYLKAAVTDAEGRVLPGFSVDECELYCGDDTAHVVLWKNRDSIPGDNGFIKLQFFMKDADLYSFQFQPRRIAGHK